jgi:hypothetical protein
MTEGARIFVQGIACGMAIYLVFDFINWFNEDQA